MEDGEGMLEIHSPVSPVVDICFIHGLSGGRVSTWSKDGVFWPAQLLSKDINDARILSWGYNADVSSFWNPESSNKIEDHARLLATELRSQRSTPESTKRPIIFVTHSLGGIVCAYLNKESAPLMIVGTLFPGWLRARKEDPETEVHVMCFFEERATHIGKIVEKTSACIEGFEQLSLSDDHIGMCKFSREDDNNYQRVMNELRRWVEAIKAKGEKHVKDVRQIIPNIQTLSLTSR
ncbi:uncharacterized protein KY384_000383 [Bacidia gigantensis]|uniref:uncharacterized protein n=1 Tax=Bacidia gigantensis TaxID=2732470 RepID=UPI001D03A0C8|nr:uncharacterized protein KY384_000383 [Bacidia gigantensis]KAG8526389.1 hypothetical protein KY384_000383 [Bacidia gigantensis]